MRRIQAALLSVVACCAAACSNGCGSAQHPSKVETVLAGESQCAAELAQEYEDYKRSLPPGAKVNWLSIVEHLLPGLACAAHELKAQPPAPDTAAAASSGSGA